MSSKQVVILGSRLLALLLTVWAFSDLSNVPTTVYSLLRHSGQESVLSNANEYWRHYYLMTLGFHAVRIVGFALTAAWLYKCSPEVEDFLLPGGIEHSEETK